MGNIWFSNYKATLKFYKMKGFVGRKGDKGAINKRAEGIMFGQGQLSWGSGEEKRVFIMQIACSLH